MSWVRSVLGPKCPYTLTTTKTCCLHYEWWVNWFEEVQKYKTIFTVRLNIRIINDVRTAMNTFRAERRYNIRYRVLDRATKWKPNNTGRVRCNSSISAVAGVYGFASFWITLSLRFQSCTYSFIRRANSGINLFSLSIHIGSTLKQLCTVRHCVRHGARVKCLIIIAILWILCVNFAPFCDCLCRHCFLVTYIRSSCFI